MANPEEKFTVGMQYDPGAYLVKNTNNQVIGALYVVQDPNNANHKLEYWAIAPASVPLGGANVNRGPLTFPYQGDNGWNWYVGTLLPQNGLGNAVHIMASCTTGGW